MPINCQGDINKQLQWNFNRNLIIFIQEKESENVLCKMAAILFQLQCVMLCTTENSEMYNKVWVSIVDADALVLNSLDP